MRQSNAIKDAFEDIPTITLCLSILLFPLEDVKLEPLMSASAQ